MSGKRYPEEFKIEAVKQVKDRGWQAPVIFGPDGKLCGYGIAFYYST